MSDMTTKKKRTRTPGATAKCRELFRGLPRDVSRKEALALCAVHGINWNTAKTAWDRLRAARHRKPEPTTQTTAANRPA
jgi:hypothetical protein